MPCEEGAEEGVAEAYPGGGHAVLPAELARVADEDNGRKVGGSIGKGGEPGTNGTAPQYEAMNVGSASAAGKAYTESHEKEAQKNENFDQHTDSSLASLSRNFWQ